MVSVYNLQSHATYESHANGLYHWFAIVFSHSPSTNLYSYLGIWSRIYRKLDQSINCILFFVATILIISTSLLKFDFTANAKNLAKCKQFETMTRAYTETYSTILHAYIADVAESQLLSAKHLANIPIIIIIHAYTDLKRLWDYDNMYTDCVCYAAE